MITPAYVQLMARYNAWQNRQVMAAVDAMDDDVLRADCGAFFGSIFGTLNHLLWGDTIWMSRWCDDVSTPDMGIPDSPKFTDTLGEWNAARFQMDGRMRIWSQTLRNTDLSGDVTWFSGAWQREVTRPFALCVAHMFNHQTHHRGQVHQMLSEVGVTPPVSDLFIMPEEA